MSSPLLLHPLQGSSCPVVDLLPLPPLGGGPPGAISKQRWRCCKASKAVATKGSPMRPSGWFGSWRDLHCCWLLPSSPQGSSIAMFPMSILLCFQYYYVSNAYIAISPMPILIYFQWPTSTPLLQSPTCDGGRAWECKYSNGWPSWPPVLSNVWIGGYSNASSALDTRKETFKFQYSEFRLQ